MLGWKLVKLPMSILNGRVNFFLNFASVFIFMTHNSPADFKLIHFLLWINEFYQSSIFATFKQALVKIYKIPRIIFESTNQYSVLWNITPLFSFSSKIVYCGQNQPIKVQSFGIFDFSGQNSSNSSCQFWTAKSIPNHFLHHFPCHDT